MTGLGTIGAFSTAVTLAGSNGGNFGSIAVGATGQVLDAYENPSDGTEPAAIFTNLDPDGGGPQPFGATRLATATNVGGFRAIPRNRTGPWTPKRSWLTTAAAAPQRPGVPRLHRRPVDDFQRPQHFRPPFRRQRGDLHAPVRVNDDTGTNSQFFCGIAVDQTTGNVAVGWFDARYSPGNNSVEYFVTASVDGGATFLPNVQVAGALSDGCQPGR